ncbi:hypothetical protein DPMN_118392 [Dreissena polymorpha]|uniref:Uncharacterized protein n=1 Tax=Dreissena polymorpha TaxID=45954 RepID=A0A9D4GK16_DREPO|nr:hypothetical protein DPMN_118392 [Dreissena polymorpha]
MIDASNWRGHLIGPGNKGGGVDSGGGYLSLPAGRFLYKTPGKRGCRNVGGEKRAHKVGHAISNQLLKVKYCFTTPEHHTHRCRTVRKCQCKVTSSLYIWI